MFIFVLYALGVWYLCGKYRRQWKGILWIVLGVGGIALVGWIHYRAAIYFGRGMYFSVMAHLLVPYGGLVAFLGGAILTFPRKRCADRCFTCGYDLVGHEVAEPICPECGTPHELPVRHMRRPPIRGGEPAPMPEQERRPAFVMATSVAERERAGGSTLPA